MVIDDPRRFGCLTTDSNGFIDRIVEKPQTGDYRLALAGVYWFRDSLRLWQTLDQTLNSGRQTNGEYYLADAFQIMLERGDRIGVQPIRSIVDVGSPGNRLEANRCLLARHVEPGQAPSHADSITIIQPVYIDPTAVVESAVIGPFVTVGPGARIRNAVIADSIIDPGAAVSNCVLRDSIIGQNAILDGPTQTLILGDDSRVEAGQSSRS
jgi:glucose-1-phosphate thymidylyltransferase